MKIQFLSRVALAASVCGALSSLSFAGIDAEVYTLKSGAVSAVRCPDNHVALFKRTTTNSLEVDCKKLDLSVACTKHVSPTQVYEDYDQGGSSTRDTYKGVIESPLGKEEFVGYRDSIDDTLKTLNTRGQELIQLGICKKFKLTIEE